MEMYEAVKNHLMVKQPLQFLFLLFTAFMLASCVGKENDIVLPVLEDYEIKEATDQKKELRFGFAPGPYGNMFEDAIRPILEEKGYVCKKVLFDEYIQPNVALANNEIDINMFQHYRYLNNIKVEYDLDISAIAEIPTAPMSIYSFHYRTINDVREGSTVSIPADATSMSRALQVLEAAGFIQLDPGGDKNDATEDDIIRNPMNMKLQKVDAQRLTLSLYEHDMSVINGNLALIGGLSLSDAIYNETLIENYINVVVVRTEDLARRYVMDIIDAIDSDEFRSAILNKNRKYGGFQLPCSF